MKTLRKGSHKKLGKATVIVETDHKNGLVTVNIGGRWIVVKRGSLK